MTGPPAQRPGARVAIVSTVALNVGDAAILEGLIAQIRSGAGPGTEIVVHDADPEVSARLYPEHTFVPALSELLLEGGRRAELRQQVLAALARRWSPASRRAAARLAGAAVADVIDALASADVVVATGGTYLVERYRLTGRLREYDIALALGKPLVFWTQSLERFRDRAVRRSLRRILRDAALVQVRDERSRTHVTDVSGRTDNVRVTADAAFALAGDHNEDVPVHRGVRRVACSVRDWQRHARDGALGQRRYEDAIAAMVTGLVLDDEAEVTFISTCQGVPEYRLDDSRIADRIVERLPAAVKSAVVVDHAFRAPLELAAELRTFDAMVSTRLHAAILGLGVGVPVLPVAYERKTLDLYEKFGLADLVVDIDDVTPERLADALRAFLHRLPELRQRFAAGVEAERRAALADAEVLRDLLDRQRVRSAPAG